MDRFIAPNRRKKISACKFRVPKVEVLPEDHCDQRESAARFASALRGAGTQVEGLTRLENVVVFAAVLLAVVDQDFAVHGFEGVAVDEDGGALIDADAQQVRMSSDDGIQIVLAMAHNNVLVNGGAGQQREAGFMSGNHHEGVVTVRVAGMGRISADEKCALDGGSG